MGEIFEYFKDQTLPEIQNKINNFAQKAQQLKNEIRTLEDQYKRINEIHNWAEQYNSLLKEEKVKIWQIEKYGSSQLNAARENLINLRQNLGLNEKYLEGYKLLNEIGHYFHGMWQYTIVLFDKSSYTFTLSEEEFLKITHAEVEGFMLNDKMTIINQLKNTQAATLWDSEEGLKKGYKKSAWTDYKYIIRRAQAILAQGGYPVAQYSQGQILEGYLALSQNLEAIGELQGISNIVKKARRRHLFDEFFDLQKMVLDYYKQLSEQTNTRGFWTGGDTTQHGQIKGENASIFKFSTILNQLDKVQKLFDNINFSKLQQKIEQAKPEMKQSLQHETQQVINKVISAFDATISNISAQDIQNDIDSIINSL